jgi:integrase
MSKRRGAREGSIFQRKDGRWVGQLDLGYVVTPQGRRRHYHTVYGTSRADVAEGLTKLLRKQHTGTLTTAGKETVGAYAATWLDEKASLRPSTRRSYGWLIRCHLIPEIGTVRLEKLTPADVRRMFQRRGDSGLAPRSVHHLRAVLSQAVKDGLIARNAAALADAVRVPDHETRVFSPEQARTFLEAIRGDRLEALYGAALALGLRQGEALGLRWQDRRDAGHGTRARWTAYPHPYPH